MFQRLCYALALSCLARAAIQVQVPQEPERGHVVQSNFLGVSIELTFLDLYTGNSTSALNNNVLNYFKAFAPSNRRPLRIRVGGNSMDSSTMDPNQSEMIKLTGTQASGNDIHCTFGPSLFNVLKAFGDAAGGAEYMLGLSLRDPNNTNNAVVVAHAERQLGKSLDVFLLGNEPDLYSGHGERPNLANFTSQNYFDEFKLAENNLRNSSSGDLLQTPVLGGPTTCCRWNLDRLVDEGYLRQFAQTLKYVTLQHYPQNNCFVPKPPRYNLDYYLKHDEVVKLAQWQIPGISASIAAGKPVIMTEFNTASCGGIPGQSDTFAATLWTVDYSLQMAAVGYTAAYLHTREENVTYGLFYRENGNYVTRPSFYAIPAVVAALTPNTNGTGGSKVVDLNLNVADNVAGYAIYDQNSTDSAADRLVLFNYATSGPQSFRISAASLALVNNVPSGFTGSPERVIHARYLTAPSAEENTRITWNGKTLAGVGDGKLVSQSQSLAVDVSQNTAISCKTECEVTIPGPGLAILSLESVAPTVTSAAGGTRNSNSGASRSLPSSSSFGLGASSSFTLFFIIALWYI